MDYKVLKDMKFCQPSSDQGEGSAKWVVISKGTIVKGLPTNQLTNQQRKSLSLRLPSDERNDRKIGFMYGGRFRTATISKDVEPIFSSMGQRRRYSRQTGSSDE